jgi:hypothetical protein
LGKAFGIVALLAGLTGIILLTLFWILVFPVPTFIITLRYLVYIIIIAGALGIIFGIIGIIKDDSKGSGTVGLILGILSIALYFIIPLLLFMAGFPTQIYV